MNPPSQASRAPSGDHTRREERGWDIARIDASRCTTYLPHSFPGPPGGADSYYTRQRRARLARCGPAARNLRLPNDVSNMRAWRSIRHLGSLAAHLKGAADRARFSRARSQHVVRSPAPRDRVAGVRTPAAGWRTTPCRQATGGSLTFVACRDGFGRPGRGLPHPELVEQDAPLRVVLVVADSVGDELHLPVGDERHDWGLVDDLLVDLRPELVSRGRNQSFAVRARVGCERRSGGRRNGSSCRPSPLRRRRKGS